MFIDLYPRPRCEISMLDFESQRGQELINNFHNFVFNQGAAKPIGTYIAKLLKKYVI